MKAKKQYWRCIYWIALAILVIGYALFWFADISQSPDGSFDKGVTIVAAIIIGVFYYGALWLATLLYEIILFAKKKISKRKFLISLGILLVILIAAALYIIIAG